MWYLAMPMQVSHGVECLTLSSPLFPLSRDHPNVWPPLQHMLAEAFLQADTPASRMLATNIAHSFLRNAMEAFERTGVMHEKYNGERLGFAGGGGEYESQVSCKCWYSKKEPYIPMFFCVMRLWIGFSMLQQYHSVRDNELISCFVNSHFSTPWSCTGRIWLDKWCSLVLVGHLWLSKCNYVKLNHVVMWNPMYFHHCDVLPFNVLYGCWRQCEVCVSLV